MKMSDKGVDSSEIVMLPSLQKRAMVTGVDVRQKKPDFSGLSLSTVFEIGLKKVSFYNIASEESYVTSRPNKKG